MDSSYNLGGVASEQSLDERDKERDELFTVSFSCTFQINTICIYSYQ